MNYELVFSARAAQDIFRVPTFLRPFVSENLRRLAEHPATLSKPSVFPFPADSQLFHFRHDGDDGGSHIFNVFFRYNTDETSLLIIAVGYYEMSPPLEE